MNHQYLVNPLQSKTKPKPEEMIPQLLSAGKQVCAGHFINWLRENKLTPKWNATNKYRVDYKGKLLCFIALFSLSQSARESAADINDDTWEIWLNIHENSDSLDSGLCDDKVKETAWENVNICIRCSKCNHGTMTKTIFGKEIEKICHYGGGVTVINPDMETLENVKKIILISKEAIAAK